MSRGSGEKSDYWYDLANKEDDPVGWLRVQAVNAQPRMKAAIEHAVEILEQEQEDIRNQPREDRENEVLEAYKKANEISTNSNRLSIAAIIISLLAVIVAFVRD